MTCISKCMKYVVLQGIAKLLFNKVGIRLVSVAYYRLIGLMQRHACSALTYTHGELKLIIYQHLCSSLEVNHKREKFSLHL